MTIDFHAHLPEKTVPAETTLESVPAGTTLFVCGTSAADIPRLRELLSAARERKIRLTVAFGLHPWFVKENFEEELREIEKALEETPEAQAGEIGLDRCRQNFDFQKPAFEMQLKVAGTLRRRATIHCVRAWNPLFEILKKTGEKSVPDLHFHRFSGTPEIAGRLLDFRGNTLFSFLERDLQNPSPKLQKVLAVIPAGQVFPESDAPLCLRERELFPAKPV